jgi:hypothetical protein
MRDLFRFSASPFGIGRPLGWSTVVLGIAWSAAGLQACVQPTETASSEQATDQSIDDALRAVQSCLAPLHACLADGGGSDCEEQLRACLASAVPDAGAATPELGHDGGHPVEHATSDGGNHAEGDEDAESERRDGGRPPLPEAAMNAQAHSIGRTGGPAALACVDTLRACLVSAVSPSTCAEDARACLLGLRDAGKH